MAHQVVISQAALIASLDSITALLDAPAPEGSERTGHLCIYSGPPPAKLTDAATGTLLMEFDLDRPAFKAARPVPGGVAAECDNMPKRGHAKGSGKAQYFRAYDATWLGVIEGSVGIEGCDMILDSVEIVENQSVEITRWVLTMAER